MLSLTVLFLAGFGLPIDGPAADPAGVERLTLLGPGNVVIATVEGGPSQVVIGPDVDAILLRPGANITMVHNHPNDAGLSAADLLQLGKPGVAAIVALGAEGSRYEASRGVRYDARFEAVQYTRAHDELLQRLRSYELGFPSFNGQIAHLTSIALHKAGVLEYRATLAGEQATLWDTYRPLLQFVTEGAASRVRRLPPTGAATRGTDR